MCLRFMDRKYFTHSENEHSNYVDGPEFVGDNLLNDKYLFKISAIEAKIC